MELEIDKNKNTYTIKIKDSFIIDDGDDLFLEYKNIVPSDAVYKPTAIALDCEKLAFIDTMGMGSIIRCVKNAISQNIPFHLTNVSEKVFENRRSSILDRAVPMRQRFGHGR